MRRYWIAFIAVLAASFAVLGFTGLRIYQSAPPIPEKVIATDGRVVTTGDEIRDGQNVWQAMGGMEMGSIWGHGSYVAPDWTADWLHREASFVLERWSQAEHGRPFTDLDEEQRHALIGRLSKNVRTN